MSREQVNDLEQRLEHWGSADTPVPDGAFTNRLDTQLRDLAHTKVAGSERRPFWQPALLTALAVLLVGAGVFAVTRDAGQEIALVMGATSQTEIELPDGQLLLATEGVSLPDGTRISVGLDGSAVVNDVVLDAGTEAVVENGALQILEEGPVVSAAPPSTRPTTTEDRTSTTTPTTAPTFVTATPTSAVPTSAVSTTAAPTSAAPTSVVPTTGDIDRSTTVPAPVIALSWEEVGGDRVLSWTYRGPDTLAGWEVIVSSGDRSQTLVIVRDPAVRSITIDALAVPATYSVVARTAEGATLAESNPIEIP